MAVALSILNAPPSASSYTVPLSRRQRMRLGLNGCGCGCNSCGERTLNSWFSDAISDAGNFHLELLDGIQRQWTGVDLIKTSFTADWVKDVSDTITTVSHIGGAIVITYWAPWLMPILVAGGKMIGTAIQSYDTRYIAYLEKMQQIPTYDISESEDKQLLMLCYWAVVTLRLMPQDQPATMDKVLYYYQLLKDKSKKYTVSQMFKDMINYGNTQMFPTSTSSATSLNGQFAYNTNATYHDAVDAIRKIYDMIFCNGSKNFSNSIYRYAYYLISGQITIDTIWNQLVTKYNSSNIYKAQCDNAGLTTKISSGNPYKNFTNYSVSSSGNLSVSPVDLSPVNVTNPQITSGNISLPNSTNTTVPIIGTTSNTTNTGGITQNPTDQLPPDTQTASIGWPLLVIGALVIGGSLLNDKKSKRKKYVRN